MVEFCTDPEFEPPEEPRRKVLPDVVDRSGAAYTELRGLLNDAVRLMNTMVLEGYEYDPSSGFVYGSESSACDYYRERWAELNTGLRYHGRALVDVMRGIDEGRIQYEEGWEIPGDGPSYW